LFDHVYHIYNIRTNKRNQLKQYLLDYNIYTEIHYPVSPNLQEGYHQILNHEIFPISEEIHNTTLSLPISFAHTKEDILYVIKIINSFFNR
jgi:dTDP-4-amino-4,6-dideoxygalactose transaminase